MEDLETGHYSVNGDLQREQANLLFTFRTLDHENPFISLKIQLYAKKTFEFVQSQ